MNKDKWKTHYPALVFIYRFLHPTKGSEAEAAFTTFCMWLADKESRFDSGAT